MKQGRVIPELAPFLAARQQGSSVVIPDIFYDVEAYDALSMEIYGSLHAAFSEESQFLKKKNASLHLNLSAIFFHELLRILCSYFFKHIELQEISEELGISLCGGDFSPMTNHPYVNYSFLIQPEVPKIGENTSGNYVFEKMKSTYFSLRESVQGKLISSSKNVLGCTMSLWFIHQEVQRVLDMNSSKGRGSWRIELLRGKSPRVYVPYFDDQINVVRRHINLLSHKLGIPIPAELWEIIHSRMSMYVSRKPVRILGLDALLTGTTLDLHSRIFSARAKAEGIPVVGMLHGGACGVLDEPVFGYGENAFSDTLIGYGVEGSNSVASSIYSKSLYGENVKCLPSESLEISRVYSENTIPLIDSLTRPRFMYVPTVYSGTEGRYGPFRDMHDIAYMEWQHSLINLFANEHAGRMIWKGHPKDRTEVDIDVRGVIVARHSKFEEMLDDADIYVFDYISTAFNVAAATSNPIIYFDIGLRNINENALKAIKERCVYVKADPRNPEKAYKDLSGVITKQCINSYTRRFSLPPNSPKRAEVIASVVEGFNID